MKKYLFFCFLLVGLTTLQKNARAQNWQLVWQDEFTNGIGPDWSFEVNKPKGSELAYDRAENLSVENGNLVITAKRESFGGYNYTSGRLNTNGKRSWKYGKIEARIKLPAFRGSFPAFWMLGDNFTDPAAEWPKCGEIDIMEQINTENKVYGSAHWLDQYGQHSNNTTQGHFVASTTTTVTDYHIYGIEWDPSYIRYYVDGVKYAEHYIYGGPNGSSELHNNMFIILNLGLGGGWASNDVDNSQLPAKMYVDWVRVYKDANLGDGRIEAENYGNMYGVQTETTTDAGGGRNVGWIDAGDWMQYYDVVFPTTSDYLVEYRVASLNGGGRLKLDHGANTWLGELNVPATGGWQQNWTTISHTVKIDAGTRTLGIYAIAGGWNLNWIRITRLPATTATARMATTTPTVNKAADGEVAEKAFTIYPNPVKQQLNITSAEPLTGGLIRIFDISGKQVITARPAGNHIDVSALAPGVYTLVFTKNKITITKEFVK